MTTNVRGIVAGLVAVAALGAVWQWNRQGGEGWRLTSIDSKPVPTETTTAPTAAGKPSDPAAATKGSGESAIAMQPDASGAGGSTARGRVARLVYRIQEGVYLEAERTPAHQRIADRLYAEVEYPDALQSGAQGVLTRVDERFGSVKVGDIVDLRIAHAHDAKNFPVRETTQVTALVAASDSELARAIASRIVARKAGGTTTASAGGSQPLSQALGVAPQKP